MNKLLHIILCSSLSLTSLAQEEFFYVLGHNDTIIKTIKNSNLKSGTTPYTSKGLVKLPFYDDFSRPGVFPRNDLWVDNNVYINNTFCVNPPSLGVATFDAIGNNGNLHAHASASAFEADRLTSLPIDAKTTVSLADNYALSFYIQPGGKGDMPEASDSLFLEFYAPYDTSGIFINEINKDLVEIYNATDTTVDIAGFYVFNDNIDSIKKRTKYADTSRSFIKYSNFQIPNNGSVTTTIAPYSVTQIPASILDSVRIFNSHIVTLYDTKMKRVDSLFIKDTTALIYKSFGRREDGSPRLSDNDNPIIPSLGFSNSPWERVWQTSIAETPDKTSFNQYTVPLSNTHLRKGFRFRFTNIASLSNEPSHARNEDHWNIDNVYIDSRRDKPTNAPDIAISSTSFSFTGKYSSIPFEHFKSSNYDEICVINYTINNFNPYAKKTQYYLSIKDNFYHSKPKTIPLDENDIQANSTLSESLNYNNYVDIITEFTANENNKQYANFDVNFFYNEDDSTIREPFRWNDTARMRQVFYNYYAYDDGSAEGGWGVRGSEFSEVAFKYTTLTSDTLDAVLMHFNSTLAKDIPTFWLCVWADNNGQPGELIVKQPGMRAYYDKGLNGFSLYPIDSESILNQAYNPLVLNGTFYIGWIQAKDALINIGMDLNRTCEKKTLFYKTNEKWSESNYINPIMLRPVFDKNSRVYSKTKSFANHSISLYPNPATHSFCISIPDYAKKNSIIVTITNTLGKQISKHTFSDFFSVSHLHEGIYFVNISDGKLINENVKLIVE